MRKLWYRIRLFLGGCKGTVYRCIAHYSYILSVPFKAWVIRRKNKIRVLYVVSEVSMWKTENLYRIMLNHPRFEPLLLPVNDYIKPVATEEVEAYFRKKDYAYIKLNEGSSIRKDIHPDIIFYQQAYPGYIDNKLFESSNRYALFCFVNYCFRDTMSVKTVNLPLLNIAWKVYSENEMISSELRTLMNNKGRNIENTGLPIMDELVKDKNCFPNRWKILDDSRKRIVYAPHHSVLPEDMLAWGSIMEYGEFILSLAEKYGEQTQWVFKPHPFLYKKLCRIWGVEKSDAYYHKWATLYNSQFVDGAYLDVIKHSDAMLHDCSSFRIEYLYMDKPVMYLYTSRPQTEITCSQLSYKALALHYPAYTCHDIEEFVINVINGHDPLKKKRCIFKERYLVPKGESACNNIISSILGNTR